MGGIHMSEQCLDTLRCDPSDLRQAMSIHTRKITDSCRDKDCIEDLRVYLTVGSQSVLEAAGGAKVRSAELLYTAIEVEPVAFDGHHYCIDITFYYRILADAVTGTCRCTPITGLAVFSKKVVLFGSEGNAKIFSSQYSTEKSCFADGGWQKTNLPKAVVEVVDPLILAVNTKEICDCDDKCMCVHFDLSSVPECVLNIFDDTLTQGNERKQVYVSIGLFSIVKLERTVQLLIPAYDFCVPQKECDTSYDCNPCDLFEKIGFPFDEFFPPEKEYCDEKRNKNCCCD